MPRCVVGILHKRRVFATRHRIPTQPERRGNGDRVLRPRIVVVALRGTVTFILARRHAHHETPRRNEHHFRTRRAIAHHRADRGVAGGCGVTTADWPAGGGTAGGVVGSRSISQSPIATAAAPTRAAGAVHWRHWRRRGTGGDGGSGTSGSRCAVFPGTCFSESRPSRAGATGTDTGCSRASRRIAARIACASMELARYRHAGIGCLEPQRAIIDLLALPQAGPYIGVEHVAWPLGLQVPYVDVVQRKDQILATERHLARPEAGKLAATHLALQEPRRDDRDEEATFRQRSVDLVRPVGPIRNCRHVLEDTHHLRPAKHALQLVGQQHAQLDFSRPRERASSSRV